MKHLRASIFLLLLTNFSYSQTDSAKIKRDTKIAAFSETIFYGSSFAGLYYLWYDDYDFETFHFFNDADEWLQMDKAGHAYSTFWTSKVNSELFAALGNPEKKSLVLGTGISMLYISTIELLDGFSAHWGASLSDVSANLLGGSLYVGQQLAWGDERILLKYSYFPSDYAQYRPDLLGETFSEKIFKDYNGAVYWLSFNIKGLTGIEKIPSWLNIAVGYGATGMTGGKSNYNDETCNCITVPDSERMREFYLSLDADLSRIKTRYKFLNSILYTVNIIKVPFPVFEMNREGVEFHLYR